MPQKYVSMALTQKKRKKEKRKKKKKERKKERKKEIVALFKDKNLSWWRLPITVYRGSLHVQKILIRRYNVSSFIFCHPSPLSNSRFFVRFIWSSVSDVNVMFLWDVMPSVLSAGAKVSEEPLASTFWIEE